MTFKYIIKQDYLIMISFMFVDEMYIIRMAQIKETSAHMLAENLQVELRVFQYELKVPRRALKAGNCWCIIPKKAVDGRPILKLSEDEIEDIADTKDPFGEWRTI